MKIWENEKKNYFLRKKMRHLTFILDHQLGGKLMRYWDLIWNVSPSWFLVWKLKLGKVRLCDSLDFTTSFHHLIILHWSALLSCVTCLSVDISIICSLMCLPYLRCYYINWWYQCRNGTFLYAGGSVS